MSKAKTHFSKTIRRSQQLIQSHKRLSKLKLKKEPTRIPPSERSDIVRAAVVLAVSAFDAYFTAKFLEKFIPYITRRKLSEDMQDFLREAGFDVQFSLNLLNKTRPRNLVKTLVKNKLEKHVTQSTESIDELFSKLDLNKLCKNAERKAKRTNLIRRIEIAIKRRHEIVHNGDLNSYGKLKGINPSDTKKRIDQIYLFVEKCDEIINSAIP